MDHDPSFQLVKPEEISVFDTDFEIQRKVKLVPDNIICILSEDKKRKKAIYAIEESNELGLCLKKYILNSNEYDFDKLSLFFDRLSWRLIKVAKKAIVNVGFYEIANDNYLYSIFGKEDLRPLMTREIADTELELLLKLKISAKKSEYDTFKNDFLKVKEGYRIRVLSQKKVLGYMSKFYFPKFDKFVYYQKENAMDKNQYTPNEMRANVKNDNSKAFAADKANREKQTRETAAKPPAPKQPPSKKGK